MASQLIAAEAHPNPRTVTLRFLSRRIALELSYDEATALATLMEMGVKQQKAEQHALRRT